MKKYILIICILIIAFSSISIKMTYAKDNTFSYAYDKNNRLTAILEKGEPIINFLYDKNGNLLEKRKVALDSPETLFTTYLSHDKASFTWDKMKLVTSYVVEFEGKESIVDFPFLELTNLEQQKEYTVKIYGKNSVNISQTPLLFTFKTIIAPPNNLSIVSTENGVNLTWDEVPNAEYYKIYRSNGSSFIGGFDFTEIGRTSDLNFEINDLISPENLEEFYVTSFNEKESVPSESKVYVPTNISKQIYEINDTKETAYPITKGSYIAYIQNLNDVDFYEIKPLYSNSNMLMVTTKGTGNIGFNYELYSGNQGILEKISSINSDMPISVGYDSSKKYYLKVSANKFSTQYPYKIDIAFTTKSPDGCKICSPIDPIKPPVEIMYFSSAIDRNGVYLR